MPDAAVLKEQYPISIEQDGQGYAVRFQRCGHTVWYAIRPYYSARYMCAVCFTEYMKTVRRERRRKTSVQQEDPSCRPEFLV